MSERSGRRSTKSVQQQIVITSENVAVEAKPRSIAQKNGYYPNLMALPEGIITAYGVSLFSTDEIVAYSVLTVTAEARGTAKNTPLSVTDHDFGTNSLGEICTYCNCPSIYCPGHFGYANLGCYLCRTSLVEYKKTLIRVVNCLCIECGKPVVTKKMAADIRKLDLSHGKKLKRLAELSAGTECETILPNGMKCTGHSPSYDNNAAETPGYIGGADDGVSLKVIYRVLKALTDEDISLLLYDSRPGPVALISDKLWINPLRNRASALSNNSYQLHPISKAYNDIIKAIQNIPPEENKIGFDKYMRDIAAKIATLDELFKKTLTDKKTGIIRGEQEGKPVTGASRAVIVPAPELPCTHMYIPRLLAETTTTRETITEENYSFMMNMMLNGAIKMIFPGGEKTDKGIYVSKGVDYRLSIGDVVDRHVVNGDMLFKDRPPTLQESAIVPCIVVIKEKEVVVAIFVVLLYRREETHTLGLPTSNTTSMAADYDGDENTVTVSQSENATMEMKGIQNVLNYLIDPHAQKAAFAPVQDALLGIYVATKKSLPANWKDNTDYEPDDLYECVEVMEKYTFVTKETVIDYLKMMDSPLVKRSKKYKDILQYDGENFSGDLIDRMDKHGIPFVVDGVVPATNLLSLILPRNLKFSNQECTIEDGIVLTVGSVVQSKLKDGTSYSETFDGVSSKTVGNVSNGLIIHIAIYHSQLEAVNFITDCTWIFTSFISFRGFSIGMGDSLPADKYTQTLIDSEITKLYSRLELDIDPEPPVNDLENTRTFWNDYQSSIDIAVGNIYSIAGKSVKENNGLITVINSGAKGNKAQLWNLIACSGQKFEMDKYPSKILTSGTRRDYYHAGEDADPISYGFNPNSLAKGTSPCETDNTQRATRSDFIVMAQKTPDVGQAIRENSVVSMGMILGTRGEIRDSVGIISPIYAADGLNPMRYVRNKGKTSFLNLQTMADVLQ